MDYELLLPALSQLVRECRSDGIHIHRVYTTRCDFTDISSGNARMSIVQLSTKCSLWVYTVLLELASKI